MEVTVVIQAGGAVWQLVAVMKNKGHISELFEGRKNKWDLGDGVKMWEVRRR